MKKAIILTYIALLSVLSACVTGYRKMPIQFLRENQLPEPDLARHKYHDIEVFKRDANYTIYFYRNESDTLTYYNVPYESYKNLNKVTYKWRNDTFAWVTLYDSATKHGDVVSFSVFGRGSTSGKRPSFHGHTFLIRK